jgi:peptidoglycan/xylan/chitin deacetylase (PgdA/CDA1 family)
MALDFAFMKARPGICILTFHGIGQPERALANGEEKFWLSASSFEAVLDLVRGRRGVEITFDDSNSSDFKEGLPALLKRGMRATFFVVSQRIDAPGFLTTDQVRQLIEAGMSIGSHGAMHRPWAELHATDLRYELIESRKQLENVIGARVEEAACPFGSYNRRVLKALRHAGYTKVYTSDDGLACPSDWILARNTVTRGQSLADVAKLFNPGPVTNWLRRLKARLKALR